MDLVAEMQKARTYGRDAASPVQLIETHISWVFLTPKYAYKIKKPTVTAFLDYSTLERRRDLCRREVELDRRYAPSLYLGVVPITQQANELRVDGEGTVVEYAVKMKRFPAGSLLSEQLSRNRVSQQEIKVLARHIAEFHGRARRASAGTPFGEPDAVFQDAIDNLDALAGSNLNSPMDIQIIAALRRWTVEQFAILKSGFNRRKQHGFIRECHGDLHAGNIVRWEGSLVPFDGVEFSEHFRWIDSLSDLAFLAMDLQVRNQPQLSHLLVNAYLEASGDYRSLAVLRWYVVYRSLVRAKVADLLLTQQDPKTDVFSKTVGEKSRLIACAHHVTQPQNPTLWITHGLSGSGKSTVAEKVVAERGAIRIRSDIERKRMAELEPTDRPDDQLSKQLYDSTMTEQVYRRLQDLASAIMEAGSSVVVDGTFLKQSQRDPFSRLAQTKRIAFYILNCEADVETLQKRIVARQRLGSDPSDADLSVLESQLDSREPLTAEEQLRVERPLDAAANVSGSEPA